MMETFSERQIAIAVRRILNLLPDDCDREGLKETPERVARALKNEWLSGYEKDPKDVLKTFKFENYDEIVLLKDIEIYSMCEHHMAPFFGKCHVGYIPNGRVIGASKLTRVADIYARRLQIQERLTMQIGQAIDDVLKPLATGVILECKHTCMMSRGVQKQNSVFVTSYMSGKFRELKNPARQEFLKLVFG
ncbi:MAG: GTP cyclohydrolase I FolE [Methanophagales archaeon]|nr:GTP cyclohydrolase I FolE [Methanophagales archaeon]